MGTPCAAARPATIGAGRWRCRPASTPRPSEVSTCPRTVLDKRAEPRAASLKKSHPGVRRILEAGGARSLGVPGRSLDPRPLQGRQGDADRPRRRPTDEARTRRCAAARPLDRETLHAPGVSRCTRCAHSMPWTEGWRGCTGARRSGSSPAFFPMPPPTRSSMMPHPVRHFLHDPRQHPSFQSLRPEARPFRETVRKVRVRLVVAPLGVQDHLAVLTGQGLVTAAGLAELSALP